MSEEAVLSYVDYCKELIKDEIVNFEDQLIYANELARELTMDGNMNESFTFSSYEAKRILQAWWDELDSVNSYIYGELGFSHDTVDVFETPEKYHVMAVIVGVERILDDIEIIQENWGNKIEMTPDVIDTIIDQVDSVYRIDI